MKNSLLFRMVVLVTALMCAIGTSAQEAYACYTPSNTTLTFYYDNDRSTRTGTTYDLNKGATDTGWDIDSTDFKVTKVIFDPSFAGARPTTTYTWFYEMESLESITGLEYLNTSEVTNMAYMFSDCGLTSLDLSHFNTSKVTIMHDMFEFSHGLTILDLSSFNTSQVTDMENMFAECTSLQTIYVGSGWNTTAVKMSRWMFTDCNSLVGGQGTTYNDSNPDDKTYAHIDGGPSNPGYFTEKAPEAYACYTSENTTLSFYYDNQRSIRPGMIFGLNTCDDNPSWYSEGTHVNVTKVVFDPSFADARPTATYGWFYKMEGLQSIIGMEYLNTSEVTDMSWMFSYCKSLTRVDVSHFNTSKVTNMDGMFNLCQGLTRLDLSSFNTSQVTEMESMFSNCYNLQTIYVGSGWNTNAVISSASMFYLCRSLVGGQGTTWDILNPEDRTYAHIDGGPSNPGYFSERPAFTRGDVNDDLDIDITDATALIDHLLSGNASGINMSGADCNLDGNINISDVTVLIDYLLSGNWPEPVYTVVGTPNLFESEWNLYDDRNNMIKGADGIYRLNKAGWFPQGTEIYFKIVTNHSYAYSWPAEDRLIYIYETGAFSIDIIFDPNAPDNQKINIDMNKIF